MFGLFQFFDTGYLEGDGGTKRGSEGRRGGKNKNRELIIHC